MQQDRHPQLTRASSAILEYCGIIFIILLTEIFCRFVLHVSTSTPSGALFGGLSYCLAHRLLIDKRWRLLFVLQVLLACIAGWLLFIFVFGMR